MVTVVRVCSVFPELVALLTAVSGGLSVSSMGSGEHAPHGLLSRQGHLCLLPCSEVALWA